METEETTVGSLTLDDYQKQAKTTAVFPQDVAVVYPALGLVDEIGELLSADLEDQDNFVSEMGDVMWYCAVLSDNLGLSLQECADNAKLSMLPDGQALFTNAATVCGRIKKMLRGDKNNDEKIAVIQGAIGDIVVRLRSLAGQFDVPLQEVCERNLDKLFDRKERGVLKGDGDNR